MCPDRYYVQQWISQEMGKVKRQGEAELDGGDVKTLKSFQIQFSRVEPTCSEED